MIYLLLIGWLCTCRFQIIPGNINTPAQNNITTVNTQQKKSVHINQFLFYFEGRIFLKDMFRFNKHFQRITIFKSHKIVVEKNIVVSLKVDSEQFIFK